MTMTQHFVNGIFFQNLKQLGIAYCSEVDGGTKAFISEALTRFLYFGTIFPTSHNKAKLAGTMVDFIGESELSEVVQGESFRFVKKYMHRPDFINYSFKWENGLWIGGYSGDEVGRGVFKMCTYGSARRVSHPTTMK